MRDAEDSFKLLEFFWIAKAVIYGDRGEVGGLRHGRENGDYPGQGTDGFEAKVYKRCGLAQQAREVRRGRS